MSVSPLVSVIIPTYNRLNLLKRAVDSALVQTYNEIEIIIVDDGSSDGTREFFLSFENDKVHYHYKKNEGLAALTRNRGAELAKGKYLAFLDSDDSWEPEKIEKQVLFMEAYPQYIFSYTQGVGISEGKEVKISGPFPKKTGDIFYPLLMRNFVITSSVLVRGEAFNQVGGFSSSPELVIAEDLDLWLKLSGLGKGRFFEEPLVFYNLEEEGLSSNITERFNCLYKVIDDHLKMRSSLFTRFIVMGLYWLRRWAKVRKNAQFAKDSLTFAEEKKAHPFVLVGFKFFSSLFRRDDP